MGSSFPRVADRSAASLCRAALCLAVLFLLASCGGPRTVSGKYFGVRNSPVATIEFQGRRAVLTTAGTLRIVFELDYETREGMVYLKDPANGPIPFKIVNSSEILCGDCAYGTKFRKKQDGRRRASTRLL
jgi:hypothetical protein